MPLLSTFGAASTRGWYPRGNPPPSVDLFIVGGGGQVGLSTYYFPNWYGPGYADYNTGGKSGEVLIKEAVAVAAGTAYGVAPGYAMSDTTAFGFTATSGNGAGGGKTTEPNGSVVTYSSGSEHTGIFVDYWGDYIGGYAYGGGGAGSAGNGSNASYSGAGNGGASRNLQTIGGGMPNFSPGGGPGYGQQVYFSSRYYFTGNYVNQGSNQAGSGGNGSGYQPSREGLVAVSYPATYDDPKSITTTYTKYQSATTKMFIFLGNTSPAGTVTF